TFACGCPNSASLRRNTALRPLRTLCSSLVPPGAACSERRSTTALGDTTAHWYRARLDRPRSSSPPGIQAFMAVATASFANFFPELGFEHTRPFLNNLIEGHRRLTVPVH